MRTRLALMAPALVLTGCLSLSLQRKPKSDDSIEVSPPGEDGTRYVAVRSGRRTTPPALKRKWAAVATKACEGDYVLINDGPSSQRRAGVVVARTHEGFVRCLMPAQVEAGGQVQGKAKQANRQSQANVSRR